MTKKDNDSTEQKIKEAARKLFTQQGYAATRTRDIAALAGINLALLNYYFRSKEKLFEIIMLENFQKFIGGVIHIVRDEQTSFDEKIELLVANYIDIFTSNPDMPLFILNEMRQHPAKLMDSVKMGQVILDSAFLRQFQEAILKGELAPVNPLHFIMNLVSLTIFPFVARPIVQIVTRAEQQEFDAMMEERKKLIPQWLKAMTKAR